MLSGSDYILLDVKNTPLEEKDEKEQLERIWQTLQTRWNLIREWSLLSI